MHFLMDPLSELIAYRDVWPDPNGKQTSPSGKLSLDELDRTSLRVSFTNAAAVRIKLRFAQNRPISVVLPFASLSCRRDGIAVGTGLNILFTGGGFRELVNERARFWRVKQLCLSTVLLRRALLPMPEAIRDWRTSLRRPSRPQAFYSPIAT